MVERREVKRSRATGVYRAALLTLVSCLWLGASGCRVDAEDLKRWETTQNGPDKLVAVLIHDKYDKDLRIEAAWSLVSMKKRGGQPVGLNHLLDELEKMPRDTRREILAGVWKKLQPKMLQPVAQASEGKLTDPSVPYKDASFAIYQVDKLEPDAKVFAAMTDALVEWSTGKVGDSVDTRLVSYEARMDNPSQSYGVEQILRKVGLKATQRLPSLLTAKNAIKSSRVDSISRVIVDSKPPTTADMKTYEKVREELSGHLANLLELTAGDGYLTAITAEVEEALKKAPGGKDVLADPARKKTYYDNIRNERLDYLFPILKLVGRKPIVDKLLLLAQNEKIDKKTRALSLAALDTNVDITNEDALKVFLAIAKADSSPDEVKHGALLRIAAYPPDVAVRTFYGLFGSTNWKVRFDGAMSVLAIMQKSGEKAKTSVKEFLEKMPGKPETGKPELAMSLPEGSSYAAELAKLPKELNAKAAIDEVLRDGTAKDKPIGPIFVALGWYLSNGTKDDFAMLAKFEADKVVVPKCKPEDDCGYDKGCPVPKPGGKPDEFETKAVATVGEYVQFCVKPQIELRANAPK